MLEGGTNATSFNHAIKPKYGATAQTKKSGGNSRWFGSFNGRAVSPARQFHIDIEKFQAAYQPVSLLYLKYTRQRQQAVLMLQHCAILS